MEVSTMQVDMAILSILAVVIVFVIGAFKQNPLHLGILGMFVAFVIGKAAGIADTTIMGFFPTTLFVRVFGIMFFFAIAQANGAIELLAKKMIAKMEEKGISRDVIDHVDANHKNLDQWLTGFGDICTSVQNTVDTIRNHPLIHKDVEVYGFVMDPHTGAMREVTCADK